MPYKDPANRKAASQRHYIRNRDHILSSARVWNANNKDVRQAKAKSVIDRNRKYILDFLKQHPCSDCKETDPVVLEFDHVRGKKLCNLSAMAQAAYSIRRIDEEIAKCEVVCANCHRRRTASRAGHYRSLHN